MKAWGLMIVAALALAGCDNDRRDGGETGPATVPPGEHLLLARAPLADMKSVGGEITTRDQADARSRIAGTLVTLRVRAGDVVREGQEIGMVTDERLAYQTSSVAAQVAAAEAEAERARADLARSQSLYDKDIAAKARLEQAIAASHAADAQVAALKAQQNASANLAQQGAILAPASGRVLHADIPAGSVVTPGMSIATITAGPPIIRLDLPESLTAQVRAGSRILVTGEELPADSRNGQVTQVYPSIAGGRVRVDATVPGLTTELVGRRVGVLIEVGQRPTLTVPGRFISTRYGIDFVDVLDRNQRPSAVPVQTAPTFDPDRVEILSGVAAGDTLFIPSDSK